MANNVALISLGCAKNLVDSENMIALIKETKLNFTEEPELAEIIIINTCGFITSAKEESINTILEMAEYKKTGHCKILIVVGCLVQKYQEELMQEIPEIDAFLGTNNYHQIIEVINEALENSQKIVRINKENAEKYMELPRYVTTPGHYAYIRIAEGCDNHCTYCVIPQLRGRYRSRPLEAIFKEAKELVARGTKEIILVAQDTTKYGKDIYGELKLPELIKKLATIKDLRWIRLLYCYPNSFTDELIEVIQKEPKVCKYIDIPIQHGDDAILRKMGRNITQEKIKGLLNKLRSKVPNITIRSTFIVGFPGETNENFINLLEFLKEMKLDRVGAFTYSLEEDTPAGKMHKQVDENIKEKRLEKLMGLQYEILREKHASYLGTTKMVQVEGLHPDYANLWICRSEGEAPDIDPVILVETTENMVPGKMIKVKITHLEDYDLIGEIVGEHT